MSAVLNEAQRRFDETYITITDICTRLQVSRTAVLFAIRRGDLPRPLALKLGTKGELHLWERVHVLPYVQAWEEKLQKRRARVNPV